MIIKVDEKQLIELEDWLGERFSDDDTLTEEELNYMLGVIIQKFEKDYEEKRLREEDIEENYVRKVDPDIEYGY